MVSLSESVRAPTYTTILAAGARILWCSYGSAWDLVSGMRIFFRDPRLAAGRPRPAPPGETVESYDRERSSRAGCVQCAREAQCAVTISLDESASRRSSASRCYSTCLRRTA